jgi:type IV pilus assembly protein PilC
MVFSRRLSLDSLIDLCRSMRYSLASGRMPHDTMQLLATEGPRSVRGVARRITRDLKSGWSLREAIEKQQAAFPPLFVALVAVGEEAGTLPEVLGELEKYYVLRQKMRRDFLQEIAWPVFQLLAAIAVIAGLIYISDIVRTRTGEPFDPLGFGLVGYEGAKRFLEVVLAAVVVSGFTFWLLKRLLRRQALVERFLLRLPLVGPGLRAMVLARFCIALHSLLEAGLPVRKVLRLAFLASDHPAFTAALPRAEAALMQGNSITASLRAARVFPPDFLGRLAVAEDNGQLPDVLEHQAHELNERAGRRFIVLNRLTSWLVWLGVVVAIIFVIYHLFSESYEKIWEEKSKAPQISQIQERPKAWLG